MSLRYSYSKHKTSYITVACLVVILGLWAYFKTRPDAPKYSAAVVNRGNITAVVQATGTISPLTTVPVGSYVSGTVKYIFADFNTRVKNGQVLAQLDPAIYEAQVTEARGNLQNAEANLLTLQANVQVDEANLAKAKADAAYEVATAKRSQDLWTAGVVSTDSNDQTQSTLGQAQAEVQSGAAAVEQAKAQLAQAKTQITAMEGALDAAETQLMYTTIISPISGTVIARNIDVGQSVAATLQAPDLFQVAQDLSRMQVYAATDESDTGNIKHGIPVTFQVDAFPNDMFHGRVSNIRLDPTTVQNVVTYNTIIDFDNPEEKLLPGETAYVTIPTGHAQNTVEIPNPALSFKPNLAPAALQALYKKYNISRQASTTHIGGWQTVWKLTPQRQLIPVAVQCGITDYNNRVISLESHQEYSGRGGAVKVHRLHAVRREEVILPEKTLSLLDRNVSSFIRARQHIKSLDLSSKKGLLFYGPPGTGKTHTIHYLASQIPEHTTLLITAEQVGLLDEYFRLARFLQPSLVVVEDVDLIARAREQMGSACEEVLLNKLLNEMDGLREDADVIFILTTNRPDQLEPALASRPGRIDQAIEFPLPDEQGRGKLVKLYSRGLELPEELLELIVRRTKGASPAFIKELMRRAAQFQFEMKADGKLQQAALDGAIEEMVFSGGALNLKLLGGSNTELGSASEPPLRPLRSH